MIPWAVSGFAIAGWSDGGGEFAWIATVTSDYRYKLHLVVP